MKTKTLNLLVFIAILFGFSLATAKSLAAQTPEPATRNDFFPARWQEYPSSPDGYRIRFPAKPREISRMEGQLKSRGLEYKGILIYRVAYVEYGTSIEDPAKVKSLLKAMKDAALNAVRDRGLLVVAERELEVDGHNGVFVHLEVQRRSVVRMEWVVAGSRLYTISTLTAKARPDAVEGKDDYENISASFINSFHLAP